MSGYGYGLHDQNLDSRTKRKIEELRSNIRYIKVLQTNDKAVFNIPVSEWLEKSESVLNEIDGSHIEDRIDKKFRKGLLGQYRYAILHLGIATDKISKDVTEQLVKSRNALRGNKKSSAADVVIGIEAEDAYKKIQQKLCEVSNDGARIIRVSGRPGVGKFAVVSKINDYVLEGMREGSNAFGNVFWVEMSPNANLADLQREIAKQTSVNDFPAATDDQERAATLLDALEKKKNGTRRRILLILDLWKDFSLEKIGIPEPSRENRYMIVVICRTLLAGRSLKNDFNKKGVVDYEIKSLSEKDTNDLFTNIVGEEPFTRLPEKTWRMLLEECDCLPKAIVKLGQAISSESKSTMTETAISKVTTDAMDLFQFSNELLQNNFLSLSEKTRPYFFYCALFPSPPNDLIESEELIRCWIYDGLMGNIRGTTQIEWLRDVNKKMKKGKKLLEEIKNAYLLEIVHRGFSETECIKMNKSVRDMAAHMSTQYRFFLKVGNGKKDSKKATEIVERASVMSDQLEKLGRLPKIKLSTLVVRNQLDHNDFDAFPPRFFEDMPNVKVLDLSGTHIESFPNTFRGLKNLHVLRLRDCLRLDSLPKNVPSFLELLVLDLSGSGVEKLPNGLRTLTKLLRLDISDTPMREFPFPDGLLIVLTGLQELFMMSSYLWTGEETVDDLKRLTKLAHLEANFSNLQALRSFVDSAEAEGREGHFPPKFRLSVGKLNLKQKLGENTLAVLINEVSTADKGSLVSLPSRNALHLMHNKNLEMLPLQYNRHTSLRHLTAINVSDCGGLVYLFEPDMFESVPNLLKIVVKRCDNMVELIKEPAGTYGVISLGSLRKLVCFHLEKLERICNGAIECESLESVSVWECDQLWWMPNAVRRDNTKPILLKGHNTWLQSVVDLEEMYTKIGEASAPFEFYSKPAYIDLSDGSKEEKPPLIAFVKSLVSCVVMVSLIHAYVLHSIQL